MPEIAHQSCYSLEEILSFYCRTLSILRDGSVREILSSQPLTVCQILETVIKVLSLFEAALSTYSDVHDSAEEVASRRQSLSAREEHDFLCFKSTISIGRMTLGKEEDDMISMKLIETSVIRLGKEVRNLERWLNQRSLGTHGHEHEYLEVRREMQRVQARIWTAVARVKI